MPKSVREKSIPPSQLSHSNYAESNYERDYENKYENKYDETSNGKQNNAFTIEDW